MYNRNLVSLLLASGALYGTKAYCHEGNKLPNIIVFLADDMGWGDVGYHGFQDIRTPVLDSLARTGVQFTQGYVAASVSGPSRAGLMTGVYQQRFAYYGNSLKNKIPENRPTMAEFLKQHGYSTGMVGKWHLGESDQEAPESRGFDYFYGHRNGSHDYYRSGLNTNPKNYDLHPIYRNSEMQPPLETTGRYLTEILADEATGFIRNRKKNRPYFLYVAFNAVHYPWQVPQKYIDRLSDLPVKHEDRRVFAGMMLAMDDAIGKIISAIDEKERENTLIFFLSDNGSPRGQGIEVRSNDDTKDRGGETMSSPAGLRGWKGDVYEGGIRIPFLMNWKKEIPTGSIYEKPVISLDIYATIRQVVDKDGENKTEQLDGVDLLPYVLGTKEGRPHEYLYWRRDQDFAIRKGDWKLEYNDQGSTRRIQLFNLQDDPYEYYDLSNRYPAKADELLRDFDCWEKELPAYVHCKTPANRNDNPELNKRSVKAYNDALYQRAYNRIDLRTTIEK